MPKGQPHDPQRRVIYNKRQLQKRKMEKSLRLQKSRAGQSSVPLPWRKTFSKTSPTAEALLEAIRIAEVKRKGPFRNDPDSIERLYLEVSNNPCLPKTFLKIVVPGFKWAAIPLHYNGGSLGTEMTNSLVDPAFGFVAWRDNPLFTTYQHHTWSEEVNDEIIMYRYDWEFEHGSYWRRLHALLEFADVISVDVLNGFFKSPLQFNEWDRNASVPWRKLRSMACNSGGHDAWLKYIKRHSLLDWAAAVQEAKPAKTPAEILLSNATIGWREQDAPAILREFDRRQVPGS